MALHFPLLSFLGASRDDSAVKVPLNPVLLEKQSSAISFSGLKANDANFCFLLSIQVIKPCAQLNSLYSATWGAPNVGPNELKMIISKRESDLIEILLWWTHFTFAISIFWYVTLTSWWCYRQTIVSQTQRSLIRFRSIADHETGDAKSSELFQMSQVEKGHYFWCTLLYHCVLYKCLIQN